MFSVVFVHFISTGDSDTSLVLPCGVRGTLQTYNPKTGRKTYNPKEVVDKFLETLQLELTSLKQPEPETEKWIRCLARNANCSNRLDVVKYLREVSPAGTTGKCEIGIADDKDDYIYDIYFWCSSLK